MGCFAVTPEDDLPLHAGTLLLVGPDEPRFWGIFKQSAVYQDGQPDPLDRWSKSVLDPLAKQCGGHALYPSDGPSYHPFYTWALRTGLSWASPIGFLVHDQVGLFASYRGALLLPWDVEARTGKRPCDTCADEPCKTACPVNAFANSYDVETCKSHLRKPVGGDCMTTGCAARRACPVGQGNRLPAQAAFHMEAFL
jgi:hypothetical protein